MILDEILIGVKHLSELTHPVAVLVQYTSLGDVGRVVALKANARIKTPQNLTEIFVDISDTIHIARHFFQRLLGRASNPHLVIAIFTDLFNDALNIEQNGFVGAHILRDFIHQEKQTVVGVVFGRHKTFQFWNQGIDNAHLEILVQDCSFHAHDIQVWIEAIGNAEHLVQAPSSNFGSLFLPIARQVILDGSLEVLKHPFLIQSLFQQQSELNIG